MEPLERLPADKVRSCIDLVNLLRFKGLEQDAALPSIAVIGDKNSGKSSVLEALSGVTLPRDLISLEISSPDVPHLTLIDLPRIPSVADSKQQLIDQIKTKIKTFITNPECIILMVVPCDVDITTTEAFKMAQEVDPDGERTLGLLTKPDIVDQLKEKTIVDIVQNKVIKLKKGFMIVRCYDQTKESLMDPNDRELKFFKEHALFKSLYDGGYATFPKLAERLIQELAQHIEKYLPHLKEYVKKEQVKANAAIKRFGKPPPSDKADKPTFLADKLNTFIQNIMRLTTGELLDLTDQNVFSVWRNIVKDSEESWYNCSEVAQHEQSGFSDFQTFDHLIKEQIRRLEEPAVFTLNSSAEIVKKELLKVVESDFFGFSNLISKAKVAISDVTSSNLKAAEFLLRTLFKMEDFEVFVEGRMWTNKKREKKRSPTAHLNSYYQTICQRLTSQIQMIIRLHMFKESSIELQKKMLQLLDDKDVDNILKYDNNLTNQREKIQKSFIPLAKAKSMLSEL
uniref:Interferon-induced GTP-binding protein Mx n=1 Tax=Neogobius melanostomus TaxID=47308 RepID=A0A8C6TYV8_9GOBI